MIKSYLKIINSYLIPAIVFFVINIFLINKSYCQDIKVIYNNNSKKVTITNNTNNTIVIFKNTYNNAKKNKELAEIIGKDVAQIENITGWCGLTSENIFIKRKTSSDINLCGEKTSIYYYVVAEKANNLIIEKGGILNFSIPKPEEPKKDEIKEPVKDNLNIEVSNENTKDIKPTTISTEEKPITENKTSEKEIKEDEKPVKPSTQKTQKSATENLIPQYVTAVNNLEKGCKVYLNTEGKPDTETRNILQGKKQECNSLLNKVKNEKSKYKQNSTEEKEYLELENKLENLESLIIKKLSHLTDEEIEKLRENYKNNVLMVFTNDSLTLYNLAQNIDKKERQAVFSRWIGKEILETELNDLKNNYTELKSISDQFIENEKKKYSAEEDWAVVENLNKEIPKYYRYIDEYQQRLDEIKIPYILFSIATAVLILMILALIFYLKTILKNKKISHKHKLEQEEMSSMLIPCDDDDENTITYKVGLDHIKDNIEKDYYELNLSTILKDTAISKVYFSRKCILDIYKFFNDYLKSIERTTETGCYIIGTWEYSTNNNTYNISLDSIIEPAEDAIHGEYELNFGAEIGISLEHAIMNFREKTGREYVQTAWMHSHPGLGLFLSNHDLVAQNQLAYSQHPNRMLAIVIDTNTPNLDMGFFAPKHNNGMNKNKEDLLQIISLETLYKWAKKIPEIPKPIVEFNNYYDIKLEDKNSSISNVLFNNLSIINIDTLINNAELGLAGYFYGKDDIKSDFDQKIILIEDFQLSKEKKHNRNNTPIGCLLIAEDFLYTEILNNYLPVVNRFDFFVVYLEEKDLLYVVSREKTENFPENNSKIPSVELSELKKWTRRKR